MSSFSWLDSSEQQRRQMLDVISLFREKGTRDELGIGTIRDAFADLLFPGTSTIQTRARYFFFIPWIYTNLERTQVPSAKISQRVRQDEVKLINALFKNGATEGLVGINARATLKRMPSAIYWQGLGDWGLRLFPGAQASYHRSLDGFYEANHHTYQFHSENRAEDDIHEMHLRQAYNWHPGLRDLRPDNFPAEATFSLSPEEAQFLQERIVSSQPGSLLAFLVATTTDLPRTASPWEQPAVNNLPPNLQEQLEHARLFSLVIYGAPLLYNLMLAEKSQDSGGTEANMRVADYQQALADWAAEMVRETAALSTWDWQDRFWQIVHLGNSHIPWRTEQFVNNWLRMILQEGPMKLPTHESARQLIQQRERRLKGKLSRLYNPRALELWNGAAGVSPLNYRWPTAQTMLTDIREGLAHA